MSSDDQCFANYLAPHLQDGVKLRAYHVSSTPTSCPPLFSPPPNTPETFTSCESHFLIVTQAPYGAADDVGNVIVLGLEVLIYTTSELTTIFVSKADSTGFLQSPLRTKGGTSIVTTVVSSFLNYLLRPRLTAPRVVLSLFARSQNQYLFPGSIENVTKHVLDDRQLIKWWCRVADPIVRLKFADCELDKSLITQAYLVVPGCEQTETRNFFPASARQELSTTSKWIARFPSEFFAPDSNVPPRCLIPRFPDDPKARFLDDLDGGQVDQNGIWKGIKSLEQFWELMSYRQECSAGRSVGFLWLTFSQRHDLLLTQGDEKRLTRPLQLSTSATDNGTKTDKTVDLSSEQNGHHEGGTDSIGTANSSYANHHVALSSESAIPVNRNNQVSATQSRKTCGQIELSSELYTSMMEHLLQLDFAGRDTAEKSTISWIEKTKGSSATSNFGIQVVGSHVKAETTVEETAATPIPTLLTSVRKKRKAGVIDLNGQATYQPSLPINTLGAGLVRKKPKS